MIVQVEGADLPEILKAYGEFQGMCNDTTNMIEKITATLFPTIKEEPKTDDAAVMELVKELIEVQKANTKELVDSFKDIVEKKSKSLERSDMENLARLP
jgi:hypothetical protein